MRCLHAVLAGCLLVLITACGPSLPDEQQIRERIEEMTAALEDRNVRAFMAPIADDFSGATWNLDHRGARLLLHRELQAHEQLRARIFDLEVELQGETRATATMHAILTGGSGMIPRHGRWYRVTTGWRRDGSDWMLISASWENVAGRR